MKKFYTNFQNYAMSVNRILAVILLTFIVSANANAQSDAEALEAAKTEARGWFAKIQDACTEGLTNGSIGMQLFQRPETALREAIQTGFALNMQVNSAATLEQVNAIIAQMETAYNKLINCPVIEPNYSQAYTITQDGSDLQISLKEGMTIVVESQIYFESAGDNKFYIKDAEGHYAGYDGKDNWTMTNDPAKKEAWTIECKNLSDDKANQILRYLIKGSKGYVATDDMLEDAPCYGDKAADNPNGTWIIEEYAAVHTMRFPIEIERQANLGAQLTELTIDLEPAFAFLGQPLRNTTGFGVNPDGTFLQSKMQGWRDVNGYFVEALADQYIAVDLWAGNNLVRVYTNPINEPAEGTKFTASFAFTTETDTAFIDFNITFTEAPKNNLDSFTEVGKQDITINAPLLNEYNTTVAELDAKAIMELLGMTEEDEAEVLMYDTEGNLARPNTASSGYGKGYWLNANSEVATWNGAGADMAYYVEVAFDLTSLTMGQFFLEENKEYNVTFYIVFGKKYYTLNIKTNIGEVDAIEDVVAGEPVSEAYYSLSGIKFDTPQRGVNIVVKKYADGKTKTVKQYFK